METKYINPKSIRIEEELWAEVDAWRAKQTVRPTRSAVLRSAIRLFLKTDGGRLIHKGTQ